MTRHFQVLRANGYRFVITRMTAHGQAEERYARTRPDAERILADFRAAETTRRVDGKPVAGIATL